MENDIFLRIAPRFGNRRDRGELPLIELREERELTIER